MPGRIIYPFTKKDLELNAKQMNQIVALLKQSNQKIDKLTKLMERLVAAMGGR